ncbi:MAG TPA: SPOR domain-containing protein [Acidobacteriaceae bacterium]|nr:SPOR domain-containing protein [Acidobacteriaceae bacterium]
MKYAVDREEETEVPQRRRGLGRSVAEEDREITLGTRSLLGIFFGLVLICGIFFGLGYSVGRVSARAIGPAAADTTAVPATSLAKPSPQETVSQPDAAIPPATDDTTAIIPTTGTPGTPGAGSAPAATTTGATPGTVPAGEVPAGTVFPANPVTEPAATPGVVPAVQKTVAAPSAAGSLMVQVAAVSVPQDADILVAALRQHGYTAVVRHEPEDQLLHVQIGPFASRAQAQAMRGRLLADGYNAVIR